MSIKLNQPVVVIGAGLAGLTAARYLRDHGVPVRVFEASPNIAGLCRSEFDEDGFTFDCGAHFINSRLAAALGVSTECFPMPRYEEAFWFNGKRYRYPFGIVASLPFTCSAIYAKATGLFSGASRNVAEEFRSSVGRRLADSIAIPLTEAWSGASGQELSPAVVQKFSTGPIKAMWLRMASLISGRTIAIGYSHEVPESAHVRFVYPKGGVGAICERLAEDLKDVIETSCPVEAIEVDRERIVGVKVNGQKICTPAVVNTAPLNLLAKLIRGSDALAGCAKLRYRPMIFVNLKFDLSNIMPDVVTWTPEDDYCFFRITDVGRALPWLVPDGKNMLTVDLGCEFNDSTWKASDEQLTTECLAGLERIKPGISQHMLGSRIVRTRTAYPVYLNEYESLRKQLELGSGIHGLVNVGRNGEFKHILMEDVYWRTRRHCSRLLDYLETMADASAPETAGRDAAIVV